MKDYSSEQRLIEKLHALDVTMGKVITRLEQVEERMAELHQDVRSLLGFRAHLLGWAAGVSLAISLSVAMVGRWLGRGGS